MLHYLRIAVTALSLAACVLLIALWVRSYWWTDLISQIDKRQFMTTIGSQYGTIYFAHFDTVVAYKGTSNSTTPRGWGYKALSGYLSSDGLFVWERKPSSLHVSLPHWLIAIVVIMVGVAPWLRLRFSLRTLLIATTLVAMGMGAIVAVW